MRRHIGKLFLKWPTGYIWGRRFCIYVILLKAIGPEDELEAFEAVDGWGKQPLRCLENACQKKVGRT